MTAPTEHQILSKLKHHYRKAAEHCDKLAIVDARGYDYTQLREHLRQIEGCCRQLHYYREDSRWLRVGLFVAEAHKRAGNWLRATPSRVARNKAHPLFTKLAENLRNGLTAAEHLQNAATGKIGMILPDEPPAPQRESRPVQIRLPSGLLVPKSYINRAEVKGNA